MDKQFWKNHGLRRTDCRVAVVGCLEAHATALSAQELREDLGEMIDRTTVLPYVADAGGVRSYPPHRGR